MLYIHYFFVFFFGCCLASVYYYLSSRPPVQWRFDSFVSLLHPYRLPLLLHQVLGGLFSLSLALQHAAQPATFIYHFILYHLLFWIAAIDQHHMVIPDSLQVGLVSLFLAAHLAKDQLFQPLYLLSAVGMFLVACLCDFFVSDGLGGGDIKLFIARSYGYGFEHVIRISLFASIIALITIGIRFKVVKINPNTPIPFGPFIVVAFLLVEALF